jgi:TrmH family RNA methyltransferase
LSIRIVLVGTTHPGNIGATARAMKNMGLHELVLVKPKFFPHEDATARASGAEDLLESAAVVETLDAAIADCCYVAGASARSRTIGWPSMLPRDCAERLVRESSQGPVAVIFGPEKSGLSNDDLDRCHTLLTIPSDPGFSSLNLAMAVQIMCYELRLVRMHPIVEDAVPEAPLASGEELENFYVHLEKVLTSSGFLDPANPRHLMRRLRRLFARALQDRNEINILRGILAAVDPQERERKIR